MCLGIPLGMLWVVALMYSPAVTVTFTVAATIVYAAWRAVMDRLP